MIKNSNNGIEGSLNGLLSNYLINKRIKAALPYLRTKRRILDIGCGMFRWENLLPSGSEYIGIDYEETIIEYNQRHFPYKFFRINAEIDNLRILGSDFDLIIMLAVIEHLNKPEVVLERLKPILSTKGIIVLTTPHPAGKFILNFGAKFRIFTHDKQQHRSVMDYKKIKDLVEVVGYRIIRYKRFLYGFNQLVILKKIAQ